MPVAIEWTDALRIRAYHVVIKGSPHKKATEEFIKTALVPENQAEMALFSGYAPTLTAAMDKVDPKIRPYLPTEPANWAKGVGFMDDKWWGENLTKVTKRWTAWASS
jgi:putative spermidine/putrescine transport system substrate-binding protein